jgi:hypothetical protein
MEVGKVLGIKISVDEDILMRCFGDGKVWFRDCEGA